MTHQPTTPPHTEAGGHTPTPLQNWPNLQAYDPGPTSAQTCTGSFSFSPIGFDHED
jgi:hypothetical protein